MIEEAAALRFQHFLAALCDPFSLSYDSSWLRKILREEKNNSFKKTHTLREFWKSFKGVARRSLKSR